MTRADRRSGTAVADHGPGLLEESRFAVPAPVGWYVDRPRLRRSLDRARSTPLVLVSAAAGSGKTSLVAQWVRDRVGVDRVAWVTFDDGDETIWPFVLRSLERLGVDVPALASGSTSSALDRRTLTELATAVGELPSPVTLVLDGFEFASAESGRGLDFLLRHCDRLRVVVVTRVDPVLPLYRYRLDGTVLEVRAADLAFTDEEAGQLLARSGATVARESVHALNARTKGWAAGLRFAARTLAALEVPESSSADPVVAEAGEVGEYLLGEVLDAQEPEVRRLLLRTSVPDTLYPGLVEDLVGLPAVRAVGTLTKVNAFLEPVGDDLGSYRYYPFFRDLLRAQLAYESPGLMVELHRRTARWLAHHGAPEAALSHLAAIGDWEAAAEQVVGSLGVGRLVADCPDGSSLRRLRSMPSDLKHPAAGLVRAAVALGAGDTERCAVELGLVRDMCRAADACDAATLLSLAVLDAVRARFGADPTEADRLADDATRHLAAFEPRAQAAAHPELDVLVRTAKGVALLRLGDLAGATEALGTCADTATPLDGGCPTKECLGYLALADAVQGRLSRAADRAARSAEPAGRAGVPAADCPRAAQVALAWVALERNDLDGAQRHAASARRAPGHVYEPLEESLLATVRARLHRADGDHPAALAALDQALTTLSGEDVWLADRLRVEAAATGRRRTPAGSPELVESLTAKEVEVLGHLAGLLSTEEIAETMFVSKNTVRTHVRNILRKLGVARRNMAVRRARELGLLDR